VSLFVDTSGLYALLLGTESEHTGIAAAFRTAAEKGRRLVTTNYVLAETSALLQSRIGIDPVRDLHHRLLPVLSVIWVTQDLHNRGADRLFRIDRRRLSLVDAISFTVMEDEGLMDVLGVDSDFTAQGFRLVP